MHNSDSYVWFVALCFNLIYIVMFYAMVLIPHAVIPIQKQTVKNAVLMQIRWSSINHHDQPYILLCTTQMQILTTHTPCRLYTTTT